MIIITTPSIKPLLLLLILLKIISIADKNSARNWPISSIKRISITLSKFMFSEGRNNFDTVASAIWYALKFDFEKWKKKSWSMCLLPEKT